MTCVSYRAGLKVLSVKYFVLVACIFSYDASSATANTMPAAMARAPIIPFTATQIRVSGLQLATPQVVVIAAGDYWPAKVIAAPEGEWVATTAVAGVVEKLPVAEGERVHKGQALAYIRSPELTVMFTEYRQALARSQFFRQQRDRDRALNTEGIVAAKRVQEAELAFFEANTQLSGVTERLQQVGVSGSGLNASQTSALIIRAPQDGTVLERFVKPGQRLSQTDPVLRLAASGHYWLAIQVPIAEATKWRKGDLLSVMPGTVQARVQQVGTQASEGSQSLLVRAALSSEDNTLRPGQFVQARKLSALPQQAFELPVAALVRHANASYVFVKKPGGFQRVLVSVVTTANKHVTVNGELLATDQVVTQGVASLKAAGLASGAFSAGAL